MQERRWDGSERITEGAELDDIKRALKDPRNQSVTLLMPGSKVERWVNGRRVVMVVTEDGKLAPA